MKLTVVGCSPAWPNPGGAQSGYLLEHDGDRLLLDCGPGVLGRLRLREPWPRIDAIVLSHLHLDHCGDLWPWLWGQMVGPARGLPAPEVWVPAGSHDELGGLVPLDLFVQAFPLHEYPEEEEFAAAGFNLFARRVPHYGLNAFGLRVERAGTILAYSGDTAPTDTLVEIARDADLFLCEATLDEPELTPPTGHLTAEAAQAAAAAAGAKRLLLTHRPIERPYPADVEFAHDGLELEI